jgi:hypothetical protein
VGDEMNWFKKKAPNAPLVWMIQKKGTKMFLGVCRESLVTLSSWQGCFRYSDMDSASLMLYWLIQSGKIVPGEYEAVPVNLQPQDKKP